MALTPLPVGTPLTTIGTCHKAEIVSSKVTDDGRRVSVIRWTESNDLAHITRGDTEVWIHTEGTTPRFRAAGHN
ncbi:hypothetical protein ACFWH1_18500 [Streptomyces sp. NPDC127037]|uniref:hypothetical protein n=1 Tax=Streptomyces sp. NPDC127037 TaxID=3347113 RepID=UPI00364F45D3